MTITEFLGSRLALVMCLFISVLGVYLVITHTGHVLTVLPYILLIACPLLHLFGHAHEHGGDGHKSNSENSQIRN
jgi:hypothetical protein